MSTETTKKKIKIDNGTNFARAYTDKAIDAKLPTDLKATATNLSLLAGDTKIGSGINLSGFEYDEETKTLKASGGSGASVSPCLNLIDFSSENPSIRTSITEEEKNNLEKHLYNSVLYADLSTDGGQFSIYFPETAMSFGDAFVFSKYDITVDETTRTSTIVGSSSYSISVEEEKNSDGTYPITIEKCMSASFGGGGNSLTLKLFDAEDGNVRTSITEEEKNNLEEGKYGFVSYYDESWGAVGEYMVLFPQLLVCFQGTYIALIYNVSTGVNDVPSISGFLTYGIEIGEKNSDGTYPLTIEKDIELPFGGGGGGAIQEIEAIKSTEADAEANQYTLSSTPTSSMFIMKVKGDDGSYSRFTMILQSFGTSAQIFFGYKIVSVFDMNTCTYAYSSGTIAILSNQCYLPPEIKDGDVGKVLVAGGNGYRLKDLPSSLPTINDYNVGSYLMASSNKQPAWNKIKEVPTVYQTDIGKYLTVNSERQAVWEALPQINEVPEASQADIGKYLIVGDNQKAAWQNLPESTSTIIRRW